MRVASSPDKAGTDQHRQMIWVRRARREGVREEPVIESPLRENHQLQPDGCGLGCGAQPCFGAVNSYSGRCRRTEATMKNCGVVVAKPQGQNWTPNSTIGSRVNVGTIPVAPFPASYQLVGGKVRRRLMPPGWGGGVVVVRGRESRPHGEGPQRVRSIQATRGGRW